jgi:hypothetical protein
MKKILLAFLIFSFSTGVFLYAKEAHSLRLIIKRVVFDEGKRAEVMTLINATDKEQVFRLEWRHLIMTEDKGLKEVDQQNLPPEIKPSKDFVRFAPRRVRIPANSSQQVRLMLRMPAGVEDGEYRSHLWIRRESNVSRMRADNRSGKEREEGKFNIGVTLLPGITIPVIVRKGNLSVTTEMTNAIARESGDKININFDILRQGERSTYGDIDLFCNPGSGGYSLRSTKGVAIYTEIDRKVFSYSIPKPEGEAPCNEVLIRYTQTDGYDGDPVTVLSETLIPVQ